MPRAPALPPLLPAPRRARRRSGSFALRDGLPVVLAEGADSGDFASARALRDALADRCGARVAIETHARVADLGRRVELRREGDAGESYRIAADADRVELSASGPAGLRYGVETLVQLVDRRGRVPACSIEDAPDLPVRGLMLDVSRGKVPTPETLREVVDRCVALKLNVLMLYVEHTFRFRRHPRIGEGASPLEAAALRELDDYAAERHVELVPSLQSLGHMEHVLALAPYRGLAETDLGWTISPSDEGTYALLGDLYDEYLPNFRSRRFNANCDEPYDLELGRSAGRARELGPGGVYLEHVRRVRALARGHGARTLIWGDVVHAHPERIPEIDRDLVLLDWWYEAEHDYERVKRFADAGLEFWVCPGTASWNCLFPRVENSLRNIERYAAAGKRHGAGGLLVTDWGDFGHYNLQGNSWFAIAWAAQQAWSGGAEAADFDRAFANRCFGDAGGEIGRLYRQLGAIHDAGFPVFNASPLQFLYFDDLDRGFFVEGARNGPLRRSLRRLEQVRGRLVRARERFARDPLTWEELVLAADASAHAVRRAVAGARYLAWRRRPDTLRAAERRRLARELTTLAQQQRALGRTLERLWLARSRPSNFEITGRRLERAIRSTRRAARALEHGAPPPPPPPHPGFGPGPVLAALREATASVRPG